MTERFKWKTLDHAKLPLEEIVRAIVREELAKIGFELVPGTDRYRRNGTWVEGE